MVIILDLSHAIVWFVGHVCSDEAEFSFLQKKTAFLMLFQTCNKLTFGLSDIIVITVIAMDRINSVSSLFFRNRILRFKNKYAPKSEKVLEQLKRCGYPKFS